MKRLSIFMEEREKSILDFKNFLKSINWVIVLMIIYMYIGGIYGLYLLLTAKAKFWTYMWGEFLK